MELLRIPKKTAVSLSDLYCQKSHKLWLKKLMTIQGLTLGLAIFHRQETGWEKCSAPKKGIFSRAHCICDQGGEWGKCTPRTADLVAPTFNFTSHLKAGRQRESLSVTSLFCQGEKLFSEHSADHSSGPMIQAWTCAHILAAREADKVISIKGGGFCQQKINKGYGVTIG